MCFIVVRECAVKWVLPRFAAYNYHVDARFEDPDFFSGYTEHQVQSVKVNAIARLKPRCT